LATAKANGGGRIQRAARLRKRSRSSGERRIGGDQIASARPTRCKIVASDSRADRGMSNDAAETTTVRSNTSDDGANV